MSTCCWLAYTLLIDSFVESGLINLCQICMQQYKQPTRRNCAENVNVANLNRTGSDPRPTVSVQISTECVPESKYSQVCHDLFSSSPTAPGHATLQHTHFYKWPDIASVGDDMGYGMNGPSSRAVQCCSLCIRRHSISFPFKWMEENITQRMFRRMLFAL